MVGLLCLGGGCYGIGATDIVFDEDSQTIYFENKRCCYKHKARKDLGPFSNFKQCVVKEMIDTVVDGHEVEDTDSAKRRYKLQFVFSDGIRDGENQSDRAKRGMTRCFYFQVVF